VLETSAFGEYGSEDAPDAGGIERSGIALYNRVDHGRFTSFIGDGQSVLLLEASDFRYGVGAAIDEAEQFEIEFINGGALLSQSRIHDSLLMQNTKAAIWRSRPG
jgi:hypothetical protein